MAKIEKVQDLDPTKVQEAIDQFGVEKVKETLVDRNIEGINESDLAPKEEVVTEPTADNIETNRLVDEGKLPESEREIFPQKAPETAPGAIPGIVPETPTEPTPVEPDTSALEEAKKRFEPMEEISEEEAEKQRQETIKKAEEEKAPPTEPGAIPKVVPPMPEEVKSETEVIAEQKNYTFEKDEDGTLTFKPKSLDEALALFNQFGPDVNLDKSSPLYGTAQKIRKQFSQYQGASPDVYLQGFKTNDIGVSGPTWDLLVSMNGGVATPQMIAARNEFEGELKLTNAQTTTSYINGDPTDTQVTITGNTLADLDAAYLAKVNQLFGNITAQWNDYKNGNDELNGLNEELNTLSEDIDELNTEKRRVLDNVKERHPNLPLSAQLAIADKELDAIDDQLFVKQREYNSTLSTYKFKSEEAKGDFEFNQGVINSKLSLLGQMYGTKRGDIIRQQDIERADKILADNIAREDELYERALKDGKAQEARQHAYQKAILNLQADLQKDSKSFQFFTPGEGIIAVADPKTGEVTFKNIQGGVATGDSTVETTGNLLRVNFTTPAGTDKTLVVDSVAQPSLESLIKQFQLEVPGGDQIIIGDSHRTTERQQELYDAYKAGTGGLAAKPGTSAHEKGLAIDIYANADYEPLNAEQVKVMNENGWFQTAGEEDMGHFEYLGTQKKTSTIDTSGLTLQDIIDQSGGSTEMAGIALGRLAFGEGRALSNQDIDMAIKIVEDNPNLSFEQAGRMFAGFILTQEADSELGEVLLSTARGITGDKKPPLSDMALSLNRGDDGQAIRALERFAINQVPQTERITENGIRDVTQRVNELLGLIQDGEELVGPVSGTLENWLGKFKTPEAQIIKNRIQKLVAKGRNEIAGVAMTPTEMELIKPLFPDIDQKAETVIDAYNQFAREALRELNNFRNNLGLPSVYQYQVGQRDYNNRADLYIGGITAPTTIREAQVGETSLREEGRTNTQTNTQPTTGIQFNLNK